MTFDDAFRSFRDKLHLPEMHPPDLRLPIERLRQQFFRMDYSGEPDAPELADVRILTIPGPTGPLKARLYVPLGAGVPPGPGILFFHGGGFVLGDLESHDMICRRMAEGSRCRVLAIDYRLAPETCFPCAHDDALAAWHWISAHGEDVGIDPRRVAVAGDSAGGNLAAFVCQQMNRIKGPRPAFQLLLYPLLQFADIRSKKMSPQESGFFISVGLFEFFRGHYLPDPGTYMDPRISPLFAPAEELKGLPPAHIIVCGWDPLHDEGLAYAAKLRAMGIAVSEKEYPSMVHGFLNLTHISATARLAAREAGKITGEALGAI
ncbi:lipase, GDXG family [Hyphomonas neptunium ATCC 15444]|uniref:Lipase, GDXG family n=2 Tax=Hyphomonas TaxID=85 RepID=Q0C5U3_HYPNA|nr:lipase, GDXG family [Hyphomonas neptunium ATCC 15444]KCZ89349.1 GDXG family lipase [Hyphomonas hirschiana VP5]